MKQKEVSAKTTKEKRKSETPFLNSDIAFLKMVETGILECTSRLWDYATS